MKLEPIQDLVAADLAEVDRIIRANMTSPVALVGLVAEHIVAGGGKRLRPLTVLLAARAASGGDPPPGARHCEAAAIIEFIHTATLLHDDVVDHSSMRRGRDTANALFGNEASVLVGDFVYSRAFQMMAAIGSQRVMEIMADATNVIAEGEVLQLMNAQDPETTERPPGFSRLVAKWLRCFAARRLRCRQGLRPGAGIWAPPSSSSTMCSTTAGTRPCAARTWARTWHRANQLCR
jgi:octaprenyl-diphosphate synthase